MIVFVPLAAVVGMRVRTAATSYSDVRRATDTDGLFRIPPSIRHPLP